MGIPTVSFDRLHLLAPGESLTSLPAKEAPALKCASCAAPLGLHEARCSYCLSWNPAHSTLGRADPIEVTNLDDPVPRYWVDGYVIPSNPTPVLQAPEPISESDRRAIDVFWRDQHSLWSLVDRIAAMVFGRKP
jgi:hypothetical protein